MKGRKILVREREEKKEGEKERGKERERRKILRRKEREEKKEDRLVNRHPTSFAPSILFLSELYKNFWYNVLYHPTLLSLAFSLPLLILSLSLEGEREKIPKPKGSERRNRSGMDVF